MAKRSRYESSFKAPDARILIVDDNEMNLEVEKKLLKDTGMTIDTAISGMAALELTALHTYDLIFMDHLMPVMDGIECLNFIRTQEASANNRVPVVVLTANAAGENRDLYARSGFEDVLVKPVSGRQMESMLLAHLPENKVLIQEGSELQKFSMNTARGYSRRIPIQIATGSMCDLPRALLRKHMIDSIPFKLISEGRIFYDGVEAEADELLRYLKEGVVFETKPPSVEEFERFFANELKKAHNVIYVAMAATVTKEYENARTAARAYGNVRVINSGQGSSAVGLLALLAQRMASHGDTPERILEKLAKTSEQMHVSFAADTTFFARNKDVSGGRLADLMKTFSIHPVIRVHNGTYGLARLFAGEMEHCFRKYVDYSLHRRAKPDLDLLIVAYSDLTEEQLLRVIERVRRRFEFAHIFFQKVSAILALNLGAGAVGLIYFEKNV
jgi:DegV family protein with EDD domain